MGLGVYLQLPAVQHALIAATLVAIISGLIGPFVVTRRAAFAVHGVSELSFTGAVAGLVWADNAVLGALLGSLVVATGIGLLGVRENERDAAIGVTLAFGLGVGVFLLSRYHASARTAQNILFGQIFGVSNAQLVLLLAVAGVVLLAILVLYRPLLFASVDPEVAAARGVPVKLAGLVFLFVLAVTVTEAAQIVGTLLVLSLAITPAAAAHRLSSRPAVVAALSVLFALLAGDGGLLVSLTRLNTTNVPASAFITAISFAMYLLARLVGPGFVRRRRHVQG
ncbi:MAG: helicase [Pseudonocardiales bacterium]|nr:MAG: helicase [Pseudonocardiales bacterium]